MCDEEDLAAVCGRLKRLRLNVVTGIIVLGLIALPSIFSWYNTIAAWDVFGNTGNLKIAVASVDEGYESDLVPVKSTLASKSDFVASGKRSNQGGYLPIRKMPSMAPSRASIMRQW